MYREEVYYVKCSGCGVEGKWYREDDRNIFKCNRCNQYLHKTPGYTHHRGVVITYEFNNHYRNNDVGTISDGGNIATSSCKVIETVPHIGETVIVAERKE